MNIATTERLHIRWFTLADASFILELVNEPAWKRYIRDMGIQSLADAEAYLQNGPLAMYQRLGFGLYTVVQKETNQPVGVCGLIKRDSLNDVDVGFALLARFRRQGYTEEATTAVLDFAHQSLNLSRIVAITTPDNHASSSLLEKLGFQFEDTIQFEPNGEKLNLYAKNS
ncbi:MAG: GNAT family N-acetyltransferase [Chloroflexota bacterium]